MSGNAEIKPLASAPSRQARPNEAYPRVRRTRDNLGDALVELIQEKPFEDITVQEVLDRAGVGRTTFYTHYRDKQDLFLSDVEDFLEGMSTLLTRRGAAPGRIVWSGKELLHPLRSGSLRPISNRTAPTSLRFRFLVHEAEYGRSQDQRFAISLS